MLKQKKKLCNNCELEKYIWKNHDGKKYCKECWSNIDKKPIVKKQTRIKPISSKQQKLNVAYSTIRKIYLKLHPNCEAHLTNCSGLASEIHHKKGRGKYYLDSSTFLAVCRSCHEYIELHPNEAKVLNLSEDRL